MRITCFTALPDAKEDITELQHDTQSRAHSKLQEIRDNIVEWGRDPRTNDDWTRVTGGDHPYKLYRKYLGKSGHRFIFEVSGERMVLVAFVKKQTDCIDHDACFTRLEDNGY